MREGNLGALAAVRCPMRRPAAALAIVALIVVACASPPVLPSRSPESSSVPTDASGIPDAVANRPELPSCGIENAIRQNGPWNAAARACFWTAHQSGQPAEFTSTRLTIEGDPFTMIYRVLGDARVEVFIDATQDRYGSGAWEHVECTSLAARTGGQVEPDFGPDESCEFTPLE